MVDISLPTVRFHIGNAPRKLAIAGRPQAIHRTALRDDIGAGA